MTRYKWINQNQPNQITIIHSLLYLTIICNFPINLICFVPWEKTGAPGVNPWVAKTLDPQGGQGKTPQKPRFEGKTEETPPGLMGVKSGIGFIGDMVYKEGAGLRILTIGDSDDTVAVPVTSRSGKWNQSHFNLFTVLIFIIVFLCPSPGPFRVMHNICIRLVVLHVNLSTNCRLVLSIGQDVFTVMSEASGASFLLLFIFLPGPLLVPSRECLFLFYFLITRIFVELTVYLLLITNLLSMK